jgi:predicted DNA-binding transcriptional regulator AlpA
MKGTTALPNWPALMRREKAAAYLDMSMSLFDRGVSDGSIPKPAIRYASLKRWRREDLDAWIDDQSAAQTVPPNTWDVP